MTSPFDGASFLFMWIGFLLLMTGGIAAFFLWAIRARQFADQDRARHLPLQSGIPVTGKGAGDERKHGRSLP